MSTVSFAQIMREQHEEEARAQRDELARLAQQEEADLAAAIAASLADDSAIDDGAGQATATAAAMEDGGAAALLSTDEDADLALALSLQLEQEQEEAEKRAAEEVFWPAGDKVRVARALRSDGERAPAQRRLAADDYDDAESDEDDDYFSSDDDLAAAALDGGDDDGSPRTKHDLAEASRRHREALSHDALLAFGGELRQATVGVDQRVYNGLVQHARADVAAERKSRGRRTKAALSTAEGVLDQRTRLCLYRLLNAGRLRELEGALASGKESVVYRAHFDDGEGGATQPAAVKVYRTTSLQYRQRAAFMVGERRFERSAVKQSASKKFVRQWAEKEMRNLRRIQQRAPLVPAPTPLLLRDNVLVMSLIGSDDGAHAAPRLIDAAKALSARALASAFAQTAWIMRRLYREAQLVHGDLSPHNLLWHAAQRRVYVIDVSQAVEAGNESAFEHLRRDARNVVDFYRRAGVANALGAHALFAFVVDDADDETAAATHLGALSTAAAEPTTATTEAAAAAAAADKAAEATFLAQPMLRHLSCIDDERLFVANLEEAVPDFIK